MVESKSGAIHPLHPESNQPHIRDFKWGTKLPFVSRDCRVAGFSFQTYVFHHVLLRNEDIFMIFQFWRPVNLQPFVVQGAVVPYLKARINNCLEKMLLTNIFVSIFLRYGLQNSNFKLGFNFSCSLPISFFENICFKGLPHIIFDFLGWPFLT